MKRTHKDIFFKMVITDEEYTFLDLFIHISQVKQFNAMLQRVDKREMTWMSHDKEHEVIRQMVKTSEGKPLSKITVKRNVTHFLQVGLLLRITRGLYKVNPKYINFGHDGE